MNSSGYTKGASPSSETLQGETEIYFQGIDLFCMLSDDNEDLPPLSNGKKWV